MKYFIIQEKTKKIHTYTHKIYDKVYLLIHNESGQLILHNDVAPGHIYHEMLYKPFQKKDIKGREI